MLILLLIYLFLQAQPKHLSCIAVSSFHLACSQYQETSITDLCSAVPDPSDLVTISQSRCSASDLLRMEAILASKLENKQQQVRQDKPGFMITMISDSWLENIHLITILPRHFHHHHHDDKENVKSGCHYKTVLQTVISFKCHFEIFLFSVFCLSEFLVHLKSLFCIIVWVDTVDREESCQILMLLSRRQ